MFDIKYSRQAVKFLKSLDKKLVLRILRKIEKSTTSDSESAGIGMDAHGFEISIGSLISVFQSRQIKILGFNVGFWRLTILETCASIPPCRPINFLSNDGRHGANTLINYGNFLMYAF